MAPDRASPEGRTAHNAVDAAAPAVGLGPALRRAWLGYQRRLDQAMADAGFAQRRISDGRVLRLCAGPAGSTISNIGRQLNMTRQGAGKIVTHLQDRGYVAVAASATSKREKAVTLTATGRRYLATHRRAVRTVEAQLQRDLADTGLGKEALAILFRLLGVLDDGDEVRLRTYLGELDREPTRREGR